MAVQQGSTLPLIDKLKGRENFNTWKFAMQVYLEHEDLWKCVDGTETDERKITRARAKIILSIDSVNYVHVQTASTAKQAWDNLCKAFDDDGLTRRVGLLRTLITTRLENCDSVDDYVNKVITTAHKLSNIGFAVSDEWIGTLLLAGLPDFYKPMIMGLESSGIAITGDAIKTKLLQDVKSSDHDRLSGIETALVNKHTSKSTNKASDKAPRCYECNKSGHYGKNCFKRIARLKRENKSNKGETSKKDSSPSNVKTFCATLSLNGIDSENWYIDSGATAHFTNNKKLLSITKDIPNAMCTIADNQKLHVESVGNTQIEIDNNGKNDAVLITDVLHVPKLSTNLLSVSRIAQQGYMVVFDRKKCTIFDEERNAIATASEDHGMYKLDRPIHRIHAVGTTTDYETWHRRLGHPCHNVLMRMRNTVLKDININEANRNTCIPCVKGKQHRLPFYPSTNCTTQPLQIVHSDLCGPMQHTSYGGSRYFLTFIDDYTRKVFVYFLKGKDEVLNYFKDFKRYVENQTDLKIKTLRTDNGREYINVEFSNFLRQTGIKHETTVVFTPEQNGVAERYNRTIVEKARCMIFDANLDLNFWAEAVNTAVYLINLSPTKVLKNVTPNEAWSGIKPNVKHLRIFGCKAMAHIPKERRRKWDPKSEEFIFVGYSDETKGYRLLNSRTKKVVIRRDVEFIETKSNNNRVEEPNTFVPPTDDNIDESISEDENEHACKRDDEGDDSRYSTASDEQPEECDNNQEISLRRSSRIPVPKSYEDYYLYLSKSDFPDPVTVNEALSSPEAPKWEDAMNNEFESLSENNTWDLVKLPSNRRAIQTKWVFKRKSNSNSDTVKFKARLVAKGCQQSKNIDYSETYAPVVRHATLRLLFALAVKHNLDIDHLDAISAFLQGELSEDIYVAQPEGFEIKNKEDYVYKFNKAIHGLKQSGRAWNNKLHRALLDIGFKQSSRDQCVYFNVKGCETVILAVYVDDLILFSSDANEKSRLKRELMKKFKIKDLGPIESCLGIHVTRDRNKGKLWLDQRKYIQDVLTRFNMLDCNPVYTPLEHKLDLSTNEANKAENNDCSPLNFPYQEAIGSLMYLSQCTRPDITYAVSYLSCFNQHPNQSHWKSVKRVMRYLKATINYRLEYSSDQEEDLVGYCDADWAGDPQDRRSMTGYTFNYQNAAISWASRKQPTVAISTTEAEYMSLAAATQEAIWLRDLLYELMCKKEEVPPTKIFCDNKSAIELSKTGNYKPRTKHIDVKHHFVREKLIDNTINIQHISSKEMVADILTKSLPTVTHKNLVDLLGLK